MQILVPSLSRHVSQSKAESAMSGDVTRDASMKLPVIMSVSGLLKHHVYFGLTALALFVVAGIWILDDYGVGVDTRHQRDTAIRNLDYVLGRRDFVYPDGVHDNFYGVSFELPLVLLERALGLEDTRDLHLMRNIVTHLFFLVSGFFCYLLAYRLFGNRLLAVLAMLLFLLHPRLYAHSFFNTKDIPFLSMFMICLYLTHRAFGNGNIWRFLVLGIAVGVLINLRIMGVTLFVTVAGMQVLDVLQAPNVDDRRRMLGSILVFVLSCGATLYAVSPALWGDPASSFVKWFITLSQHPSDILNLFRGDLIISVDVNPPEYVPVWMSITMPPVALALGVAGMLIVFLRGLTSPREILANTRLRFGFLLVGCFMLPILSVIVLGSNVYNGWRQMYFLYAPFCLLALFGVQWVTSALLGRGVRLRVLTYGSVGAGMAAIVAAMVSIHPHHQIYFNFLVDRTTPEHLRSRYDMDYWLVTIREGYEHLLERHPSGSLHVHLPYAKATKLNWEILSESDRERLILQGEHFDFYITAYKNWVRLSENWVLVSESDVMAPLVHSRVIYNSKVLGVAAVDLSPADEDAAARYREMHRSIVSGEPVASSEWDVYAHDGALAYIKDPCADGDYARPFFLHVTMDDIDDVPDYRRRRAGTATRNFDFEFDRFGVRFDGVCMAVAPLPADGVSGVRTGQFAYDGELWGVAVNLRSRGASGYRAEYESVIHGNPVINSEFDVYLHDGRLVYVKDPCDTSDVAAEFFLRVVPSDVDELQPSRRESGFDDLDFVFATRGLMLDGMCIASIGLPDYAIERVTTGQFSAGDRAAPWEGGYNVSAAAELPRVVADLRGRGIEPAVSSYFDVYLDDGRLIYFRSPCVAEYTADPFFLHLHPADADDLPPPRGEARFDSFSFGLLDRGAMSGDGCFTSFNLPNYDVAGFSTGQFVHGDGNLWEGAYSFVAAELPSIVEELRERGVEPVVRSYFDVYLDDGRLVYFRSDCTAEDADAPFFVHVHPDDLNDLPLDRRSLVFDSFSFGLFDQGVMVEGGCITSFALPDYEIAGFTTGQFLRGEGDLWEDGHSLAAAELPRLLDRLRRRGVEPVVRSYFNVYMDDDRLIYVREPCIASDTDAEFFLHIVPLDVSDLPPPRGESGFDNLDFVFDTRGLMFDGMCIASIGLPDYDIERIRTGQWDPEQQRDIWKEEFEVIE